MEAYFAFRSGLSVEIVGDPLHLLTGEARGTLLTKLGMLKAAHDALDHSLEEQHESWQEISQRSLSDMSERDQRGSNDQRRSHPSDDVLSGGMRRTQAASNVMLEEVHEEVGRLHSDGPW